MNTLKISAILICLFCIIIKTNSQVWDNKILSTYPSDNSIRIGENDSLVLNFQNPVSVLKGNLIIYNEEGTAVETIPLDSKKVKGQNSTAITISHDVIFRHDYSYYIQIDTGSFGNGFSGVQGSLTWNFSSYNVLKEIIPSQIMGDRYKLFIGYPENYDSKRINPYPVVFLPDGNWIEDFTTAGTRGIMSNLYKWMKSGNIPDVIFVGIGYPNNQTPSSQRMRDFLFDQKADKYFGFLKNELIPYIEGLYNTDPHDRTLLGYSYGGAFSFYTMMQYYADSNRIFKNIMAGDPALSYPGPTLTSFSLEQDYHAKTDSLPVNLFMATGDPASTYALYVKPMNDTLNLRMYKGLKKKLEVFPYADHLACNFPAYEEAMYWFFNKEKTDVIFPTYPRNTISLTTAAFNLNNYVVPKGGTFSGEVTNDSIFDPRKAGLGEHLVTYHYTDTNGITVLRNYLLKVYPYNVSSSVNYLFKTDSIETFAGELSLPDAPDTLTVYYSISNIENQYDDYNAYFKIKKDSILISKALPSTATATIYIGVKAITALGDTFTLPVNINLKNSTLNFTDVHTLNRSSQPGMYVAKMTVTSERNGFIFSLPDTGSISYDNQYFRISNDSLLLNKDFSQLGKNRIWVNVMAVQKNGCSVYQKFSFSVPLSLSDDKIFNIDIYPNPLNSYILINGNDPDLVLQRISICDLSGRIILSEQHNSSSARTDIEILNKGLYLLYIDTPKGRIVKKIIIE